MKITNGLTLAAIVASMATTTVSVAQDGGKGIKQKDGFTLMPSGLEYKIVKHGDGKRKAANTDHAELFIHVYLEDSVIFDSRKMYNETKPVPVTIANPKANGDLMEGFMMLVAGDSAIFHVPVDSMLKGGVQPMPGMKPGVSQKMRYEVQVVTVRSEEEEKKFAEAQAGKQ
jgi:FKBP-type peptidyl-prolyl cis-trans isomerase